MRRLDIGGPFRHLCVDKVAQRFWLDLPTIDVPGVFTQQVPKGIIKCLQQQAIRCRSRAVAKALHIDKHTIKTVLLFARDGEDIFIDFPLTDQHAGKFKDMGLTQCVFR